MARTTEFAPHRGTDTVADIAVDWLIQNLPGNSEPLKKARAIVYVKQAKGWNSREFCNRTGYGEPLVSRLLGLLKLPAEVQGFIESGSLGWSTVYALTTMVPESQLVEFAREAVEASWTRDKILSTIRARYPSALDGESVATDPPGTLTPDAPGPDRGRAGLVGSGLKPYRLTVRQFERMIDAGVFPESHDVELLGGILVDKMTKYEPHNFALARLGDDLRRVLPEEWAVREEKPVRLGAIWRPEPDLAVVRGPHERYGHEVPHAGDISLLVEAADSSYQKDRGAKWAQYAAAGVPTYWIVNIPGHALEIYTDPAGCGRSATYRDVKVFRAGEAVPVALDGNEVGRIVVRFLLY